MIEIVADNFNIEQIADSGQCFRFKRLEYNKYYVIAFGKYLEIVQNDNRISFSCSIEEWEKIYSIYFDMHTDYNYVSTLIRMSNDKYLQEAFRVGSGIRILKQDLWESIISFIVSQNNNIPRIKNSIEAICYKAGILIDYKGIEGLYAFPGTNDVDKGFFIDKQLGLGYRDTYLENIYEYTRNNPNWLNDIKSKSYEEAFAQLLSFKGIGKKVANCICLFGLHHIDAFPIDTHINQILDQYYPNGFDYEYYKGYAGIVQQYMFYNKQNNSK